MNMSKEHDPEKIQEKINAGLTLEQAIEVLDRQTAQVAPIAVKEKKNSRSGSGSAVRAGATAGEK